MLLLQHLGDIAAAVVPVERDDGARPAFEHLLEHADRVGDGAVAQCGGLELLDLGLVHVQLVLEQLRALDELALRLRDLGLLPVMETMLKSFPDARKNGLQIRQLIYNLNRALPIVGGRPVLKVDVVLRGMPGPVSGLTGGVR